MEFCLRIEKTTKKKKPWTLAWTCWSQAVFENIKQMTTIPADMKEQEGMNASYMRHWSRLLLNLKTITTSTIEMFFRVCIKTTSWKAWLYWKKMTSTSKCYGLWCFTVSSHTGSYQYLHLKNGRRCFLNKVSFCHAYTFQMLLMMSLKVVSILHLHLTLDHR